LALLGTDIRINCEEIGNLASILIIDDNEDIRELYKRILERAGYEVMEAANGKVGIKLYREHPADLIITDIIMPEKEGIETIRDLCRDFPEIKIIAISGGGAAMDSEICLALAGKMGARKTLRKPIEASKLLAAISEVLAD
jgi:CheY-like chemotaxis protein